MPSTTCTEGRGRGKVLGSGGCLRATAPPRQAPGEDTRTPSKAGWVLAALLAFSAPAGAQDVAAGCWARDYSAAHLAANPAQVVAAMRIVVPKAPRSDGLRVAVTFSQQGHVAGTAMAGRRIAQGMFCLSDAGPLTCGIECDGGTAVFRPRADGALDLVTNYLLLGDPEECGGIVDLAEVSGQSVTYRLYPVDPDLCAGM